MKGLIITTVLLLIVSAVYITADGLTPNRPALTSNLPQEVLDDMAEINYVGEWQGIREEKNNNIYEEYCWSVNNEKQKCKTITILYGVSEVDTCNSRNSTCYTREEIIEGNMQREQDRIISSIHNRMEPPPTGTITDVGIRPTDINK